MFNKIAKGLWFVLSIIFVGIAIRQGALHETYAVDGTGISWFLMSLFVLAMWLGALHYMGAKWVNLEHVRHLANDQVYIGLFGTLVGIYMALRGVQGTEADLVLRAVPNMMLAFWTSIIGMSGAWVSMKTYQFLGGQGNE
jgi:hypothetical protein